MEFLLVGKGRGAVASWQPVLTFLLALMFCLGTSSLAKANGYTVNVSATPSAVAGPSGYANVVSTGTMLSTSNLESDTRWLRCTNAVDTNPSTCSPVTDAGISSYTTVNDDFGSFIRLRITVTSTDYYSDPYWVAPTSTGAIFSPAPTTPSTSPAPGTNWDVYARSTANKAIFGVPSMGGSGFLPATIRLEIDYGNGFVVKDTCPTTWRTAFGDGTLADAPCVLYSIGRNLFVPSDAGGRPYRVSLTTTDVRGTSIPATLTGTVGTNGGGGGGGALPCTSIDIAGPPVLSTSDAVVGATVAASSDGGWSYSPSAAACSPLALAWQWVRYTSSGATDIPGATARVYAPTAADVGSQLAVCITASGTGGVRSARNCSGNTGAVRASGGGSDVAPERPTVTWKAQKRKRTVSATVKSLPGVSYTIAAVSGKKRKSGQCRTRGSSQSCSIKLGKGRWKVTVTPRRGSVVGTPAVRSVKF